MNPFSEPPSLGSSFQQARADRSERPGRQIVSTVEEIIETGGQPA
jgi:hypothetical protein